MADIEPPQLRPTAVVTGAGSGIGAAVAVRLVADGRRVVAVDRAFADDQPVGERVVGDLTAPETATAVAELAPLVDSVVNAAGVRPTGRATRADSEEWRRTFDVNVIAAAALVRALEPSLQDGAAIVNVASGAFVGKRNLGVYGASKAALVSWSRSLAAELAPRGIRVNVVVPGATETAMLDEARLTGSGTDEQRAEKNLGAAILPAEAVGADIVRLLDLLTVTGAVVPLGLLPSEW